MQLTDLPLDTLQLVCSFLTIREHVLFTSTHSTLYRLKPQQMLPFWDIYLCQCRRGCHGLLESKCQYCRTKPVHPTRQLNIYTHTTTDQVRRIGLAKMYLATHPNTPMDVYGNLYEPLSLDVPHEDMGLFQTYVVTEIWIYLQHWFPFLAPCIDKKRRLDDSWTTLQRHIDTIYTYVDTFCHYHCIDDDLYEKPITMYDDFLSIHVASLITKFRRLRNGSKTDLQLWFGALYHCFVRIIPHSLLNRPRFGWFMIVPPPH